MYAVLPGQLAVVVLGGVQGHVRIGDVVADIGGSAQDPVHVAALEGVDKSRVHEADVPGHDAIGVQRVLREFGHCIGPTARHHGERIRTIERIVIDVDVMAWCLALHRVTAPIGIHGVITQEIDVLFEERKEFRRHGETSHPVDALVAIEAPGLRIFLHAQGPCDHCNGCNEQDLMDRLAHYARCTSTSMGTSTPSRSTGMMLL